MIQKRKKQIKFIILIAIIIGLIAGGTFWILANHREETKTEEITEQIDFSSKRLIVTTDSELKETYNAKSVNKMYSGKYAIKYETETDTKNAYKNFKNDPNIQEVYVDKYIKIDIQSIEPYTIQYSYNEVTGISYDKDGHESWGTYAMGLDETQTKINSNSEKKDVVVALIDSGFDLNHSFMEEQNLISRIDKRYKNVTNNSDDISDRYSTGTSGIDGHGTQVGSIILDATPDNVKILPIKVEDDAGEMTFTYILEAIQYAIDMGVDVMNISLGADEEEWGSLPNEIQTQIENIFLNAFNKNITIIAASGNDGKDMQNTYPAALDGVFSVGALQTDLIGYGIDNGTYVIHASTYKKARNSKKENLSKPDFSNFGEKLDFNAPGKEILCMIPKDANNGKGIIANRDFMCFALYSCNSWNYKKLQQRIDK